MAYGATWLMEGESGEGGDGCGGFLWGLLFVYRGQRK